MRDGRVGLALELPHRLDLVQEYLQLVVIDFHKTVGYIYQERGLWG